MPNDYMMSSLSLPVSVKKLRAMLEQLEDLWNSIDEDDPSTLSYNLPRYVSGWKVVEKDTCTKDIDGVRVIVSKTRIYISVEQ